MSVSYRKNIVCGTLAAVLFSGIAMAEPKIEVLHYWTSGGEEKAKNELQKQFQAGGGTWTDTKVAGGGGDAETAALRAGIAAGDPPGAAQIKGPTIHEYAELGALDTIDDVAKAENWDAVLPPQIKELVTYQGHYVGAPVNIHRINWVWMNPAALKKAGVEAPQNWDQFFAAADKLKAAGIIPMVHPGGGENWDGMLFEPVLLSTCGGEVYKKAFVDLDDATLRGDCMKKSFDLFRKLSQVIKATDKNYVGRPWNEGTQMVMKGQAAMQIMGDWAKGEFSAAGLKPGTDFICQPVWPGSGFILNSDSFGFFNSPNSKVSNEEGKKLLAKLIMDKSFQETFNLYKGSIPARTDVPRDKFDSCAIQSMDDLNAAVKANSLVPTLAHQVAVKDAIRGPAISALSKFFQSDQSTEEGVKALADGIASAK